MTGQRSALDFALATTILCCLAACAQSLSVRKLVYSRPADDDTYQEGKILFGDVYGQNGGGPSGTSGWLELLMGVDLLVLMGFLGLVLRYS